MNKEALVEDYKDTLNDDYDDGQALESFKAPLPDFANIKHRTESDKLTKDEKKLLIHFQDLNKLRKIKKDVQNQVLKLQEEKKRKAEEEKTKRAIAASSTNKLASAVQAKERAKWLLQSGAIKLPSERRKDFIQHKRSMSSLQTERNAAGRSLSSQELSPPNGSKSPDGRDVDIDDSPSVKRPRTASRPSGLYDNFVPAKSKLEPMDSLESPGPETPRTRVSGTAGNTLFVRSHKLTTEVLTQAFEKYGPILAISIEQDEQRAFVTLESAEEAARAIEEVYYVNGFVLQTSYARRQTQRSSSNHGTGSGRDRSTATWGNLSRNTEASRKPSEKLAPREMVEYQEFA